MLGFFIGGRWNKLEVGGEGNEEDSGGVGSGVVCLWSR